jgi:hypothetical protein
MRALILILFIGQAFYLCISDHPKRLPLSIPTEHHVDPYAMISEGNGLLKEGDLVVRLNQDPTSQFIKNFNRHDKSYSHAGIVLFENGHPYIYHIVNGADNPGEKLRKDSLSKFCDPRKNMAYGIFRYKLTAVEIKNLKALLHQWCRKAVRFDPTFNLKTDDKMYCSEMIGKLLAKATNKRILIETTPLTSTEAKLFSMYAHLSLEYTSKLRVISIDNLYRQSSCYAIKEYSYGIHR